MSPAGPAPPVMALAALARGEAPDAQALLPTCTAEGWGAEVFAATAIAELFARHPAPLSDTPDVVSCPGVLAVFDAAPDGVEQALFADVIDGRVARLWRLGGGDLDPAAEPRLTVGFDPFLSQVRDPVAFEPGDHAHLPPEAAPAVAEAAAGLAAGSPEGRVFVLRAFASEDRCAALVGLTQPSGVLVRRLETRWAAMAMRLEGGRCVHARTVWDGARTTPTLLRL